MSLWRNSKPTWTAWSVECLNPFCSSALLEKDKGRTPALLSFLSHLPNHYGRDLNACCIPSRPNARRTLCFDGVVFCRVPLNLHQLTTINIWVAVILSNYKLIFSRIQHHNQIIFAFLGPISSKPEIKVHIGRRKEALPFIKKGLCNDSSTLSFKFSPRRLPPSHINVDNIPHV